ncbi:MAG: chorismate synthase [Paramuribaculum sp.]|nr:chorismate synthase [Paramuribaculum sp.]
MNSFGEIYRLTTFGESHGPALGGVIDGMPAGLEVDMDAVQQELDRRRPGQSAIVTGRQENDRVTFLSGIFEGKTTGTPIGFTIANTDQHSKDYEEMRHVWRPSHADMTYTMKYGTRDHRGGGRASARETAARVVGGALARQVLSKHGITVAAYTSSVGPVTTPLPYSSMSLASAYDNDARCPDKGVAEEMIRLIKEVKKNGDTIGGTVTCVVSGVPPGLGEPLFDKLQSRLAAAMLSIPAAKGFDYGMGFDGCGSLGSEMADTFIPDGNGGVTTATNHSGGIQGGISNGSDIYFRVAFKPVATLLRRVDTTDDTGQPTLLQARGRHDPCVLPRAVPIVEAMTAMVILDALLKNRTTRL